MLLTIGNYTVDIKARKTRDTRNSKDAAMQFLCEFANVAGTAAERYEERYGKDGLSKTYSKWFDDIYDALDANGYFDAIETKVD